MEMWIIHNERKQIGSFFCQLPIFKSFHFSPSVFFVINFVCFLLHRINSSNYYNAIVVVHHQLIIYRISQWFYLPNCLEEVEDNLLVMVLEIKLHTCTVSCVTLGREVYSTMPDVLNQVTLINLGLITIQLCFLLLYILYK